MGGIPINAKTTDVHIRGVQGESVTCHGLIEIQIHTENWQGQHQFAVCEMSREALIGMDFLRKHTEICEVTNGVIRFKDTNTDVQLLPPPTRQQQTARIKLINRITIQAGQEITVLAKTEKGKLPTFTPYDPAICEPINQVLTQRGIMVAPT
jgi:hypothetical protein